MCQGGDDVHDFGRRRVLPRLDPAWSHEDQRHMGIVGPGAAVHGGDLVWRPSQVPAVLRDQQQVPTDLGIPRACHHLPEPCGRHMARGQLRPRVHGEDPGIGREEVRRGGFHIGSVQVLAVDEVVIPYRYEDTALTARTKYGYAVSDRIVAWE
jgi:hypothetical protein